jgi:hypothetical protein
MRQVAGVQRMRIPGVSVSNDFINRKCISLERGLRHSGSQRCRRKVTNPETNAKETGAGVFNQQAYVSYGRRYLFRLGQWSLKSPPALTHRLRPTRPAVSVRATRRSVEAVGS